MNEYVEDDVRRIANALERLADAAERREQRVEREIEELDKLLSGLLRRAGNVNANRPHVLRPPEDPVT